MNIEVNVRGAMSGVPSHTETFPDPRITKSLHLSESQKGSFHLFEYITTAITANIGMTVQLGNSWAVR